MKYFLRMGIGTLLVLQMIWIGMPFSCHAMEKTNESFVEDESKTNQEITQEDIGKSSQDMLHHLDTGEIDQTLEGLEIPENMSFQDLIMCVINQKSIDGEKLLDAVMDVLFGEISQNKNYVIKILLLAVGFALLKNFAEVFDKNYISNVCFLLVYCLFMVLLMKSLLNLNEIVTKTIERMIDFMTAFIPVFTTTVVFASGTSTASGFYQIGFLVVYLLQWVLGYFVVPLVRIYVVLGFVNYIWEDGKFEKMTELLETIMKWTLRLITSGVLGLNIMKAFIAPVTDSFTRTTLRRSLVMVPGIGNVLGAASDLFIASGNIIKNGVGLAALVVLILICAFPLLKIIILMVMYKLLAAVAEPVCDKRICNALNIISKGSGILFSVMASCVVLIFITVAMTTLLGQQI